MAVANAGFIGAPVAAPHAYAAPVAAYAAPVATFAAPHAVATHTISAPAVVSQQSNILRSHGNLGQVSTFSKSIQTPFSSVSKHDVRVSNDAIAYAHAPVAYTAHVPTVSYAAPVAKIAAAPVAYAAPVAKIAAAPVAYAAPAAYAAPVAKTGLLGVAYSAAPVVSHMTYSNSYGTQYAW